MLDLLPDLAPGGEAVAKFGLARDYAVAGPKVWARVAMITAGSALLIVSSVRMQIALSGQVPSLPLEQGSAQGGFVPMMAQEISGQQQESILRLNAVFQGQAVSHEGEAGEEINDRAVIRIDKRPVRLVIPAIGLDAPVLGAALLPVETQAGNLYQWRAPDAYAVGWHYSSAVLGERGNTVLNGHHNAFGEVFRQLDELEEGDRIFVFSNEGDSSYHYEVTEVLVLEERSQPIETRLWNARFISPTSDERLTLITCWPYETNTHRLIIIARPIRHDAGGGELELDPG